MYRHRYALERRPEVDSWRQSKWYHMTVNIFRFRFCTKLHWQILLSVKMDLAWSQVTRKAQLGCGERTEAWPRCALTRKRDLLTRLCSAHSSWIKSKLPLFKSLISNFIDKLTIQIHYFSSEVSLERYVSLTIWKIVLKCARYQGRWNKSYSMKRRIQWLSLLQVFYWSNSD